MHFEQQGLLFVVALNEFEALCILLWRCRRLSFIHLCRHAFIEEAPALPVENDHALMGSMQKMTCLTEFFWVLSSDHVKLDAGFMLGWIEDD